jgi:hypothetical protein
MSTLPSYGGRSAAAAKEVAGTSVPAKAGRRTRQRHTPGGSTLGKDAGAEAQRMAAAILDVLAGLRTPGQAAEALGISQPRYFQMEAQAMQALVDRCKPRPRGRGRHADKELASLRRQLERLQQEVNRQQTLLRLAQRSIGLPPPRKAAAKSGGKETGKRRPRRPVVRALRAAEALHRRSQESGAAPPSPAATPTGPDAS